MTVPRAPISRTIIPPPPSNSKTVAPLHRMTLVFLAILFVILEHFCVGVWRRIHHRVVRVGTLASFCHARCARIHRKWACERGEHKCQRCSQPSHYSYFHIVRASQTHLR